MTAGSWPVAAMAVALPYGLAVGVAYLLALRVNTRLYLADGPLWQPIGLMLVRLLGSVALLGAAVPWGWAPTLVALAGFGLARPLTLRWLDRRERAGQGGEGRQL
jgi:hypothetical protein